MSYMHFIFQKEKSEDLIGKIGNILESMYSQDSKNKAEVIVSKDRVSLKFADYQFTYAYIGEDWVQEESRDIADTFGKNRKDQSILRDSKSRIEFYGDDDFDMNYFNDYLLMLERIQRQLPVIIFDTENGHFFDEI